MLRKRQQKKTLVQEKADGGRDIYAQQIEDLRKKRDSVIRQQAQQQERSKELKNDIELLRKTTKDRIPPGVRSESEKMDRAIADAESRLAEASKRREKLAKEVGRLQKEATRFDAIYRAAFDSMQRERAGAARQRIARKEIEQVHSHPMGGSCG